MLMRCIRTIIGTLAMSMLMFGVGLVHDAIRAASPAMLDGGVDPIDGVVSGTYVEISWTTPESTIDEFDYEFRRAGA
jgi:hypothetical protein